MMSSYPISPSFTRSSAPRGRARHLVFPAVLLSLLSGCQQEVPKPAALTPSGPVSTLAVVPKSDALLALTSFDNKFYNQYGTYGLTYKANYWFDQAKSRRMDFWTQAEAIEMVIDAYNVNPTPEYKNRVQYLYNGMRDAYGTLWSTNEFNDDVIWGSLMCLRAYDIWNDGGMLTMTRQNFDLVWARAWDTNLGGGLWWKTDKQSKNRAVQKVSSRIEKNTAPERLKLWKKLFDKLTK